MSDREFLAYIYLPLAQDLFHRVSDAGVLLLRAQADAIREPRVAVNIKSV